MLRPTSVTGSPSRLWRRDHTRTGRDILRRSGVLIAIGLLVPGCTALEGTQRPFQDGPKPPMSADIVASPTVMVAPVGGPPPQIGRVLAELVADALRQRDVIAVTRTPAPGSMMLTGHAEMLPQSKDHALLRVAWSLTQADGLTTGTFQSEQTIPVIAGEDPYQRLSASAFVPFANRVAFQVADQMQNPAKPVQVASIAADGLGMPTDSGAAPDAAPAAATAAEAETAKAKAAETKAAEAKAAEAKAAEARAAEAKAAEAKAAEARAAEAKAAEARAAEMKAAEAKAAEARAAEAKAAEVKAAEARAAEAKAAEVKAAEAKAAEAKAAEAKAAEARAAEAKAAEMKAAEAKAAEAKAAEARAAEAKAAEARAAQTKAAEARAAEAKAAEAKAAEARAAEAKAEEEKAAEAKAAAAATAAQTAAALQAASLRAAMSRGEVRAARTAESQPAPDTKVADAGSTQLIGTEAAIGAASTVAMATPAAPPPDPTPAPAPEATAPAAAPPPSSAPPTTAAPATTAAAESPAASRTIVVAPVQGAPGNGNAALTTAIKQALVQTGLKVTDYSTPGTLVLHGRVSVSPASAGTESVSIEWAVYDSNGRFFGTVTQRNELPRALVRGQWDETAPLAATGAVSGIRSLIVQARPIGPS